MVGDSPTIPLSEYCLRITKGTTPTTLGRAFVPKGINFVKSEAITEDGRIDPSTFAFIDSETHQALSRSILQESDVLFSMAGVYLGKTAVVPRSILPASTNQAVGIVRVDQSKADPRFIHYVLSSPSVRDLVQRGVAQSAQPNFNLRDIGDLPIPNLPLKEQRAIAHILGTLDDKIELNRRMNETLEAMARATFKSWFVEFDPVRAKAEGRQPFGIDPETAALFPDSFQDSSLGKIPKGWTVTTLDAFAVMNPETWTKETAPPQISYVDLSNVKWGRIESTTEYAWREAPSRARRILRSGDTIVGTVRPANGSYALISDEGLTGSTGFAVLRPRKPEYCEVVYLAATAPDNIERLGHLADGAAYPAVRPDVVASTQLVRCTDEILDCFHTVVRPLLDKVAANHRGSRTLAAIRDTLLPKLISGEVRVPLSQRPAEVTAL